MLFTGDLVQHGKTEEYRKMQEDVLDRYSAPAALSSCTISALPFSAANIKASYRVASPRQLGLEFSIDWRASTAGWSRFCLLRGVGRQ